MIPALAGLMTGVPVRVYAYAAAALALLGYLGCERHKRTKLEKQLAAALLVVDQIKSQGSETRGRLDVSLKRVEDVDLRTRWLLKEFGANLPKDEEGARLWALKAAKELNQ